MCNRFLLKPGSGWLWIEWSKIYLAILIEVCNTDESVIVSNTSEEKSETYVGLCNTKTEYDKAQNAHTTLSV